MSKSETAVFDFTKVSKQWNLKFGLTLTAVARAEITLKRPAPQGRDYDALQAFYDKQEEALTVIERLASEQAGMVAEVLVSVPESWLLEDAPGADEIDWSNADNLNYVQADRYNQILEMIRNGEARNTAKN